MTKLTRLILIPVQHNNFILICCLIFFSTALSAQTIVNREWVQNAGTPDEEIDWQASVLDVNGDILTTSNTVTSGQAANIYTTKIGADGTLIWEREYNHSANDKDYGAAIITDASGNVYVAGAVTTANGYFDYMVLKYAANGTLLWTATHNGASDRHDVPVAIAVDGSGNVYVSGGSENGVALVDYCTIKYDSNGNEQWISHYDHNNLYDAPVALQIDMSGNIVVTGASADNTLNWESATVKYNATTGAEINTVRVTQTSGIHEPTDFDIDLYGNFYIVGNATTGGTDYDIRTIKLSPELNIEWVEDYDGAGFEDGATTIDVDDYGNVFVGGYTQDANGAESALIIKYDEFGTQVSVEVDDNAQSRMAIKDIRANDGGVLVTGGIETDGTTDMFVRQYDDMGNIVWQHNNARIGSTNIGGTSIGGTSIGGQFLLSTGLSAVDDNLFVVGTSDDNDVLVNTTTSYNTFTRPTDVVTDTDGNPLYMDRMVIVRFHRDAVKTTAVNNTDIIHGRAPTFLTNTAVNELNAHLSFDIGQAHMIKVFKRLTSTHTTTTSRLGATVPIPDFWTSFVLVLPENVAPLQGGNNTTDVLQTCDDLERAFPTVRYAHPNFIAQLHGSSDDSSTENNSSNIHSNLNSSTANDSLYDEQPALHPGIASDGMFWDSAHTNIEEAWGLEATGKPFVRVGIFDSGLFVRHEDFGYDDSMGTSPIVPDGWDLGADVGIYSLPASDLDKNGHGTKMAGVMGAIRNNQIGIAGVAGGDYNTSLPSGTPDYGISMYPLKIGNGNNSGAPFFNSNLEFIADAIIGSALSTDPNDAIPYDYGLHIMNNSWGVPEDNFYDTEANDLIIQDAVHLVNRLNIIFVVSRGDRFIEDRDVFPATYFDPWVINVGASGKDLEFPSTTSAAPYGKNLDVVAPFSAQLVKTTDTISNVYVNEGGCSVSAAHVSGIAGLLLGYMNDPSGADYYGNLAPEDVEHILQETADDITQQHNSSDPLPVGYDGKTGHGRVNAGEAIKMVRKPQREIKHFGTWIGTPATVSDAMVETDVMINLTDQYVLLDGTVIPDGEYTVDIHRVDATISHVLDFNDTVIDSWPRHSLSDLFGYYDSDNDNEVNPYEFIYLDNANFTDAQLYGYIYNLKLDAGGQNIDYWIPYNVSELQTLTPLFEYTLLVDTGILDNVETVTPDEWAVKVIPNPAHSMVDISLTIEEPDDMMIALYDIKGRFIQQVLDSKMIAGEHRVTHDVSKLSSGVYYFEIRSNSKLAAKRFVKL